MPTEPSMFIVLNCLFFYLKHRDVYIVSQWNLKLIFSPLRRQGVGFHLDGFKLESNSNLKPRYSNFLKETDTSFIIDVK